MEQSSAVDWSRLPADILIRITSDAGNSPAETVAFRSVCHGWRLSIPSPPNKLSAIFPLKPSIPTDPALINALDTPMIPPKPNPDPGFQFVLHASAVYLVRPRSDPSGQACLVSVEESSPGSLVLRDPLVFRQVFTSIDPDWIAATQTLISRSFSWYYNCSNCHTVRWSKRMVYVPYSGFGCRGLIGVCETRGRNLFVFKTGIVGNTSHRVHKKLETWRGDLVAFNGHVIVVDNKGRIYVLDQTSLALIHLNSVTLPRPPRHGYVPQHHFVVSDGELYLVVLSRVPTVCETYRLVINADDHHEDGPISSLVVEEVEDLGGDRVFFVTKKGSFSVSARDLPPPWKGNCVVTRFQPPTLCECESYPICKLNHEIFFLGGGQKPRSTAVSSLPGYSDLLSPWDLLVKIKDLDLGQDADITAA